MDYCIVIHQFINLSIFYNSYMCIKERKYNLLRYFIVILRMQIKQSPSVIRYH